MMTSTKRKPKTPREKLQVIINLSEEIGEARAFLGSSYGNDKADRLMDLREKENRRHTLVDAIVNEVDE